MEDADVPRRGGVNRFGPFTGGSAMNTFYRLISTAIINYRSISQLRTIKTLTATEHMLHHRRVIEDIFMLSEHLKVKT